MGEEEWRL
uniref:Uncharacterized protein n=1 Tax=Anguilla anguilla TaxID=7936 RepID=A0A0E9UI75_ANGAN